MDEPFSAVDPVVREGLQDELLRLQAELDKTIVFVTHDIDEAIRLGDKVAVFRVGGKLAQYASPPNCCAHPPTTSWPSFVGRDRGYRGLGSSPPTASRCRSCRAWRSARPRRRLVATGCSSSTANASPSAGWLPAPLWTARWPTTVSSRRFALRRRRLATGTAGSLRSAMDAALSSPSGHGVAVDGERRVLGACRRNGARA